MPHVRPLIIANILLILLGLAAAAGPAQAEPAIEPIGGRRSAADHRIFLPLSASSHPVLRISALYYDALISGEPDEAFQLWNISHHPARLLGYQVTDGRRSVAFPDLTLPSGAGLWCARQAVDFARSFGFSPACEYGADTDPAVPDLTGAALRFANSGGQALLHNPAGALVDALVYAAGDPAQAGWQGPALEPYAPSSTFGAEGQILYRKFDWSSWQPLADSDSRADWAQDPDDPLAGRRVQYPGWDLEQFGRPQTLLAGGAITVALAPDNLFEAVSRALAGAQHSIRLESYSFEHVALAELLAARASAGVSVTLLLEGSPAGGLDDQARYVAQVIEAGGGQVWFMVNDRNAASDRYRNQHAKFAIIDERLLLISSENFVPDSMPDDDKRDGTLGRRGAALLVDAPALVAHALALFQADFDPAHHNDLFRWTAADPKYGAPLPDFEPRREAGGDFYQPVHEQPLAVTGVFTAQFSQAPETSLLPPAQGSLLGLAARAGPGDVVLVQQLYERVHWGGSSDTPLTAPNLRLSAYIDAARRGAQVRILLDSFFDHGDNVETAIFLEQTAAAEALDLAVRLGDPAGGGLHNKMALVQAGGQGWVHVGSLNGSEASAKVNRELALQVQSDAVYSYLATAFWRDWQAASPLRRQPVGARMDADFSDSPRTPRLSASSQAVQSAADHYSFR